MKHKARIILVAVIFIIIIGNIAIYEKYGKNPARQPADATGNIVAGPGLHTNPDRVEIEKGDLKSCCTFVSDGKEQNCYVLKRFDCSYCQKYCQARPTIPRA